MTRASPERSLARAPMRRRAREGAEAGAGMGMAAGVGPRLAGRRIVGGWSGSLRAIRTTKIAATTTPRLTRSVDTSDPIVTGGQSRALSPADYGWGPGLGEATTEGVSPSPPRLPGRSGGRRRWVVVVSVVSSLLLLTGAVGTFIRLPYDSIAPGSARRVDDLIVIRDHPVYPPRGRVLFTTVSVREGVNLWETLGAWLDRDVDLVSDKEIRGSIPPSQYHQLNVEAMTDSKSAAEAVVLSHLGFTDLGGGAEVLSVELGSPASSVLHPKEVIVAADGAPVKNPSDLVAVIRARHPGDVLRLSVTTGEAPAADRTATLARGEQGQALLGVRLGTKLRLPFPISIDSGNVEGPSAGLAYAIALLDALTPGELTGGAKVAATGELEPDGKVDPVGGVAQKVVAVRRSGAALMLVPKGNYAEARAHAGSRLRVVAVDTFDDALRAIGSLPGSNAPPLAHAGSGGA